MNKEIIEGNKLIHEFRGAKESETHSTIMEGIDGGEIHVEDLTYHSSWEKLMDLVDTIESLDGPGENFHIFIGKRHTRVIYDYDTYTTMETTRYDFKKIMASCKDYRHCIFDENKKLSTWQAIVDFIEWHNKKNEK